MVEQDTRKPVSDIKKKIKSGKSEPATPLTRKRRLIFLFGLFMIGFVILAARLGYVADAVGD